MTAPPLLLGLAGVVVIAIEWHRGDQRYRLPRALGALAAVLALGELLRAPEPVWSQATTAFPRLGLVPELDAPLEVAAGAPLVVRGRLALDQGDSAWVILLDPVGPRDSALVRGDRPFFTLLDRPRAPGTPRYVLRVRNGWTETAETLGVAVHAPRWPAVLVLDGSPSFETSSLKRWLGREAARVTVRTAISRDRYRVESVNGAELKTELITGSLLKCYDLVVADQAGLADLSAGEKRSLRQSIESAGLGLLIVAGPDGQRADLSDFATAASNSDARLSRISWSGAPRSRIGVETEDRHFLKQAGVEELAWDDRDRLMAVRRRLGAGWVGSTLVRTPSRWLIESETQRFGSYWSLLLGAVARDTSVRAALTGDARRYADQTLELSLWSRSSPTDVAILAPDGTVDTLPLARDPFNPSRWTSRYWPRAAGWHTLLLPDRQTAFLVRPSLPAAASWIAASETGWRRGFAFLVLLVALTGLWVEARQRGR